MNFMNHTIKIILFFIFTFVLLSCAINHKKPSNILLRPSVLEAHKKLNSEFLSIQKDDVRAEILSFTLEHVLEQIQNNNNFEFLFQIRFWCGENQEKIIPELIKLLNDHRIVGLTNSNDVIIWDRIIAGDLVFYGHGWLINDDIFSVAGRASWLLKESTCLDFGNITMKTSNRNMGKLKKKWIRWVND